MAREWKNPPNHYLYCTPENGIMQEKNRKIWKIPQHCSLLSKNVPFLVKETICGARERVPSTRFDDKRVTPPAFRKQRDKPPRLYRSFPQAFQRSICCCVDSPRPISCPVNFGNPFNASLRTVALPSSKNRNNSGTNAGSFSSGIVCAT